MNLEFRFLRLMNLLRYGSEEEITNELSAFIKDFWQNERGKRIIRRLCISAKVEPRSKIKRGVLKAFLSAPVWDDEIIDMIFFLSRNDPDVSVRELARKVILGIVNNLDEETRKKAVIRILRAINMGDIHINPMEIVRAMGVDNAVALIRNNEVPASIKELLEYALEKMRAEKS